MLPVLSACSSGDDPYADWDDFDYQMWECGKRYIWTGLWYEWECPNGSWDIVPNQPIFTSNDDCHHALHVIAKRDPDVWDHDDEAKKNILRASGYAIFLACFEV